MERSYTIVIKNASQEEEDIKMWEKYGMIRYQLPDDMVLLVDEKAPEEIKIAAEGAEGGNYYDFLTAIGEEDLYDDDEDLEDDDEEES